MFDKQQLYRSKIDIVKDGVSVTGFPVTISLLSKDITKKPVFWESDTDTSLSGQRRSNIRGYDLFITLDYNKTLEPTKVETIFDGLVELADQSVDLHFYPDADEVDYFVMVPTEDMQYLGEVRETITTEIPTFGFKSKNLSKTVSGAGSPATPSGGDADTLGGLTKDDFLRSNANDTYESGNTLTINGDMNLQGVTSVGNLLGNPFSIGGVQLFATGEEQGLGTSDSPEFADLTLSGTVVGSGYASDRYLRSGAAGAVVARTYAQVLGDLGLDSRLTNLTNVEIQQLENIGTTSISTAQWGYLGALDQGLGSTASPTFNNLTINGVITDGLYDSNDWNDASDRSATALSVNLSGLLTLTRFNTTNLEADLQAWADTRYAQNVDIDSNWNTAYDRSVTGFEIVTNSLRILRQSAGTLEVNLTNWGVAKTGGTFTGIVNFNSITYLNDDVNVVGDLDVSETITQGSGRQLEINNGNELNFRSDATNVYGYKIRANTSSTVDGGLLIEDKDSNDLFQIRGYTTNLAKFFVDVDINGTLDVSGVSSLASTDITGTLDVTGFTEVGSFLDNQTKLGETGKISRSVARAYFDQPATATNWRQIPIGARFFAYDNDIDDLGNVSGGAPEQRGFFWKMAHADNPDVNGNVNWTGLWAPLGTTGKFYLGYANKGTLPTWRSIAFQDEANTFGNTDITGTLDVSGVATFNGIYNSEPSLSVIRIGEQTGGGLGSILILSEDNAEWRVGSSYQTTAGYFVIRNQTNANNVIELSNTNIFLRENTDITGTLDVSGDTITQGRLFVNAPDYVVARFTRTGTTANPAIQLWNGSGVLVTIGGLNGGNAWISPSGANGYLGIGTSSPSQKLDVNGNVKANDFILT